MLQVVNVQVPFIFKYLVDYLNDPNNLINIATAEGTVITMSLTLVLGCKCILIHPVTHHGMDMHSKPLAASFLILTV